MEEDIEILKRITVTSFNTNNIYDDVEKVNTAIENLINRVKELEEELDRQINAREIEEKYVEENFITRAEVKEGLDKQDELLKKYYIPKSKIKEKIEELEKDIETYNIYEENVISILQKLLEE